MWYQNKEGKATQLMSAYIFYYNAGWVTMHAVLRDGKDTCFSIEKVTEKEAPLFIKWIVMHFFDLYKRPLQWKHFVEWKKNGCKEKECINSADSE